MGTAGCGISGFKLVCFDLDPQEPFDGFSSFLVLFKSKVLLDG